MEEEEMEPEEGDYVVSYSGCNTFVSEVGGYFVRTVADDAEAYAVIRERMDKDQCWPNVWTLSDHGNIELVTLESLKE